MWIDKYGNKFETEEEVQEACFDDIKSEDILKFILEHNFADSILDALCGSFQGHIMFYRALGDCAGLAFKQCHEIVEKEGKE